ncbi:hypothetical protein B5G43_13605 [Flavonifractor sp. An92]|uniref:S-layer homology domain-containing protein n=1 Tax=Flavonifractor sp. An92 TaxID=1965666 RepID=UPI000B38437D|nr:S-layer homology domain-containing protein [Flavonifractor sp. An92]OUN05320.1 hypothetical protein B5G43_13605 [Flavonifractor sp. An92]
MKHTLPRALAPLGLALALTLPVAAAGMSSFVPKVEYTPFSDVDANAWYAADVEKAVELGLMKGKGDGRFDPQGTLSLAEAITMAVQVHATYTGESFTPGGSTWYQNAVDYALENGLVLQGEYNDYTAPATRADMAGIFAYALPTSELERINRVANVPDVTSSTDYAEAIYLLYNAGVLAGTGNGSFAPDTTIDRASAAAILNRIALPESRVELNMDTPASGTTVESPDKAFRLTFGAGDWKEITEDGASGLTFTDQSGTIQALSFAKADGGAKDLETFSVGRLTALRDELGGVELLQQPGVVLFRGLPAVSWRYQVVNTVYTVFCVENSGSYVELTLSHASGASADTAYQQLLATAYTLDLAL